MNPSSDDLDIIRSEAGLAADLRAMIEQTREAVARTVNAGMTLLYWRVGRRIQIEILKNQRAEYGGEILATLSQELSAEFGKGFSYSALTRMLRFAENFPEASIVSTLSRQLGWSHFKEIIPLKHDLQRDFYAEMCRVERWSVRTLRAKIDSMLFERTAISKKPHRLTAPRTPATETPRRHRDFTGEAGDEERRITLMLLPPSIRNGTRPGGSTRSRGGDPVPLLLPFLPLITAHCPLITSSSRYLVALPSVEKLRRFLEADRERIQSHIAWGKALYAIKPRKRAPRKPKS
jgi:DUF1016 N-terminal domain